MSILTDRGNVMVRRRSVLVGSVVLALVASLGGPAVAVDSLEDAAGSEQVDVGAVEESEEGPESDIGKLVPTSAVKGEELAPAVLSFTQVTPVRPGGSGRVKMMMAPESRTTEPMRDLVVVMKAPQGLTWVSPRNAVWSCGVQARGTRLTCARNRTVGSGESVALDVKVKVSRDRKVSRVSGGTARITGTATWHTGRGTTRNAWLETGSGVLAIQPAMQARLRVAGDGLLSIVSNADRDARAVQLIGNLSHVSGQQIQVSWRQVRGPQVAFMSDQRATTDEDRVSQTALLPRGLVGNHRLVFEMTARSGGQAVKARASVLVTSNRLQGPVNPRNGLIAPALDQAPDRLPRYRAIPEPSRIRPLGNRVRLVGPVNGLAEPGESVVIRLESDLLVRGTTWITQIGVSSESTSVGGLRREVVTPEAGRGPMRITVYASLANGRSVVRSFTLLPEPADDDDGTRESPGEEENRELLCSVATNIDNAQKSGDDAPIVVTTKDKSELALTPSKATIDRSMFPFPGECSGEGTITFGSAKLTASAGMTFMNVEGTISLADGIQMTTMSWVLNPELLAWVPDSIRTMNLAGRVSVAFDSKEAGHWAAISGTSYLQPYSVSESTFTGIPFVPLPDGWSIDPKQGAFLQFFEDDDKGAPAGSIQLVQRATGGSSATGSAIQISLVRQSDARNRPVFGKVIGAASNMEIFETPRGDSVVANGDFAFDLTRDDTSATQLNLGISCADPQSGSVNTACPIADEVHFKDGTLRMSLPRKGAPTTGGYLLEATFAFGTGVSGASSFELSAQGAYKSKDDWSVSVNEDSILDMGPGLNAVGFQGIVKNAKEEVDGKEVIVLTFNILTRVTEPQFANAVDVKDITARITNRCEEDEPNCQASQVRLKVAVSLVIPAPANRTIDAVLSGQYNWATKGLIFEAAAGPDTPIGPAEWNFKAGAIFAARSGHGYCQSQDSSVRAPSVWAVGFRGQGTLFDNEVRLTLQFSEDGSCIWGSIGKLDIAGLPTSGVVVSWTSFAQGATVKVSDKESFTIKANTGSLRGKVDLPKALNEFLGVQGQLVFTGEISGKFEGGRLEVAYTGVPTSSITSQGANSFDLTRIALGINWKTGKSASAELYAGAEAMLTIRGDGKEIQDSRTPLGVYLSIAASSSGVGMKLSVGTMADEPISNAFGVQGLTVLALAASAEFQLPPARVQVSFEADVRVPKAWESSGLKPNARIAAAFSIGTLAPWCVDLTIGDQYSKEVALDVANAGFLVAYYFKLLIAPAGCTVPINAKETREIPPGYGFAFDGYIIGAPIVVALNVGLGTGGGSSFTMQGQLNMPKLDLPLITLSGADGRGDLKVTIDIDTARNRYDAAIDAGVLVGYPDWGLGARVAIKGQFRTSGSEIIFQVQSSADFRGGGAYLRLAPLKIDLAVPKGSLVPTRAAVNSRMEFGIFGVKLLSGEVDLAYDRGLLVQFGIVVGAELDIEVASLSGYIGFRYCLGSISESRTAEGRLADCSPFAYKTSAKPGYLLDLGGRAEILGIGWNYYWAISEQRGAEGDPAFEPKQRPGPLPGPTADIQQLDQPHYWFMGSRGNVIGLTHGTERVRFRSIRPADVEVPRESRTVKACASIQVGTEAYRPQPGTYPNATPTNPTTSAECGLIGSTLTRDAVKETKPKTFPIICTQLQCVGEGRVFRLDGPEGSVRQARDKILAQLRQPPGVLQQDAYLQLVSENSSKVLTGLQAYLAISASRKDAYQLVLYGYAGMTYRKIAAFSEFPVGRKNIRYWLTDRGVLRSSLGGSVGATAALDKSPPVDARPALALIGEEMVVYCGPTQSSGILWKYGKSGYERVAKCSPRT